jgi:hypothetical protein
LVAAQIKSGPPRKKIEQKKGSIKQYRQRVELLMSAIMERANKRVLGPLLQGPRTRLLATANVEAPF